MWFRPAGAGMVDGAAAVGDAAVGDAEAGAAGGFPAPSSAAWPPASRWGAMVTVTGIRMTTATAMAAITRPPMAMAATTQAPMAIMADPITPVITAATAAITDGIMAAATGPV